MNESATIANMAIAAIAGYTLGALPVAYIAGRTRGINVFEVGSRQAGATNVFRAVSRKLGILVFLADSTKGLIAVLIGHSLGLDSGYLLIPAVAAVMGHWNSPFTRFKGGDGVSTLTGIGIGLIGDRRPAALRGRRRNLPRRPFQIRTSVSVGSDPRLHHVDDHRVRAVRTRQQRFDSGPEPRCRYWRYLSRTCHPGPQCGLPLQVQKLATRRGSGASPSGREPEGHPAGI